MSALPFPRGGPWAAARLSMAARELPPGGMAMAARRWAVTRRSAQGHPHSLVPAASLAAAMAPGAATLVGGALRALLTLLACFNAYDIRMSAIRTCFSAASVFGLSLFSIAEPLF